MSNSKKKEPTASTSMTTKDKVKSLKLNSVQNSQTEFLESHLIELERIKSKIESFQNEYYTKNK